MIHALRLRLAFALSVAVLLAQPPSQTRAAERAIAIGCDCVAVQSGGHTFDVYTYRPQRWSGERLFVVMHGVLRNAADYRDGSIELGDRFDALIVVPEFDVARFPSRAYQRGGLFRDDGQLAPAHEWTWSRVPEIARAVRERAGAPSAEWSVIGHSAGGQFVVRMAAFLATDAVRLVAVNPGSLLFPTRELPFGYGFGGLPDALASDERLRAYLAAPLVLYVGTADDRRDEFLDTSSAAMQQGEGRHQRSVAAFRAARTLAEERGWPFHWQLIEVDGAGHDSHTMFEHDNCRLAVLDAAERPPTRGSVAAQPAIANAHTSSNALR